MNNHGITNTISGAAITSPWWLDSISGWAAAVLPILGVAWLVTQIVCKIIAVRRTTKKDSLVKALFSSDP